MRQAVRQALLPGAANLAGERLRAVRLSATAARTRGTARHRHRAAGPARRLTWVKMHGATLG
ncbi:MAG: hypothetical protein WBO23_07720 [Burkholderiales bacterium]